MSRKRNASGELEDTILEANRRLPEIRREAEELLEAAAHALANAARQVDALEEEGSRLLVNARTAAEKLAQANGTSPKAERARVMEGSDVPDILNTPRAVFWPRTSVAHPVLHLLAPGSAPGRLLRELDPAEV